MAITKTEVLEVLDDARLHSIRFSVGPIIVDQYAYEKVHDFIASGGIRVKSGKEDYSLYIPKANLFKAADRNPPLTNLVKTNILHECTHIISDYTRAQVTRLTDEVAAYMAQIAYHLLLEPTYESPSLRIPYNNMVRLGVELVKKYKIGQPDGTGASVGQKDIDDLARMINVLPDYANIKPEDMLDSDGVDMEGDVLDEFLRLQKPRPQRPERSADQMEVDRLQAEGTKIRITAQENYPTSDSELLQLFTLYAGGSADRKKAVEQKLAYIFANVTQRDASAYRTRLVAPRKGDPVSEQFHAKLPAEARKTLVETLARPR